MLLPKKKSEYFAVLAESNIIVLIPGKNIVVILAGITLVLEETHLMNEYHSLFPVLQLEVLNFYTVKNYTWLI